MIAVMVSVWNEQRLLPGLLESLRPAVNIRDVYCFDGRWSGFDALPGYGEGDSTDETRLVVLRAGARWVASPPGGYESDGPKRTAAFQFLYLLGRYYHCYVIDADERHEGQLTGLPPGHANVLIRSVGPNDLPGLRGEWPRGDYGAEPHPQLRLFRLSAALECKWPGGYWDEQGRIEPYTAAHESALPVLGGCAIRHEPVERDADRLAAKARYYAWEVPERRRRQEAEDVVVAAEERRAELGSFELDQLQASWRSWRRLWHEARIAGDRSAEMVARDVLDEIEAEVNR